MNESLVTVAIVTFNSAGYIQNCLQYLAEQDYQPLEVVIVDNASTDGTPRLLRPFEDRYRVVYNVENNGFAGGQNQAITLARGAWVLTLNPDVRLTRDFISNLVRAGETDNKIGTVCGKLLAMSSNFQIPSEPVIDSTGIYFTPNLRHFDRGSKLPDRGQFDRLEYVFGATGAAALYRTAMIRDVSLQNGGFFDPDFFAYREDADVAWRAQLLGWNCLYTPGAVAYHVRSVLPSNREAVAKSINMHSVKNRFLMRFNNIGLALYWRNIVSISFRDLLVVGACLTRERSSLKAFVLIWRNLRRTIANRRDIQRRRRVTDRALAHWFRDVPSSQ